MLDIPWVGVLAAIIAGTSTTLLMVAVGRYRKRQADARRAERLYAKFAELDTQRSDGQLNGWFDKLERSEQDAVVDHMAAERGKMRDERWKARQEEAKKQRELLGVDSSGSIRN